MKLTDFKIGTKFELDDHLYRCTDVGSRVVVAIRIDQMTLVTHHGSVSLGNQTETSHTLDYEEASAKGWLKGPPYSVAERVFDEDDIQCCTEK